MFDTFPLGSPTMTRMPPLARQALRLLLVTALAGAALVAWSATAQAGVMVTIQPPGKVKSETVSTDEVEGTIDEPNYKVAKPTGGTEKISVSNGVSMIDLLEATNTNFDFATIKMSRDGGTTLTLTRAEAVGNPRNQPFFYTDAQNVTHFVGLKGSNGIVPAKDYFEVSGTVVLVQARESRIAVTISPKKKEIELGGSVSFTAKVTGVNELDDSVVYSWTVDGKLQRGSSDRFRHKFPQKDEYYKVAVTAKADGGTANDTDVATITVGDPQEAEQKGDEQLETNSTVPGPTYEGSSGPPAVYEPTPTPTPITPTPPTAEPAQPPDVAISGTPVEGNLLADVSDPPPSNILESARRAARDGTPQDAEDGDVGVSEAAVSIVAALALLGLGAGIETRQGRLPRLRLPRRGA